MPDTTKEALMQDLVLLYQACLTQENYAIALRVKQLQGQLLGYIGKKLSDKEGFFTMAQIEQMDDESLQKALQDAEQYYREKFGPL